MVEVCDNGNCRGLEKIHLDLRGKITEEGRQYYDNGNQILAQFNSDSGSLLTDNVTGRNDSILTRDFTGDNKLSYLNQLSATQTEYQAQANYSKDWDDTTRSLNGAGQALVAIAVVAATGGLGAGISGAMMTAAATTAGTTAAISATNASMNVDGNFFSSLDDLTGI